MSYDVRIGILHVNFGQLVKNYDEMFFEEENPNFIFSATKKSQVKLVWSREVKSDVRGNPGRVPSYITSSVFQV